MWTTTRYQPQFFPAILLSALLTACGGGGSDSSIEVEDDSNAPPPPTSAQCETSDSGSDSDQCGTLLLGLTDADGDFLQYEVDVVSLTLERANGTSVDVLPSSNTVDFAQYVEVTELVTAATVPAGTYVRGEITLDYRNANIQVEVAGEARPASVVDENGDLVEQVTLALTIDNRNQLVIAPGVPAMLTADFDLAGSHTVDLGGSEPVAELYPVLVAEVNAHEQKEFRIRGPLIAVDEGENDYRIAVRPFLRNQGRFGGVDIETDSETVWVIDGESYTGAAGLAAMADLEAGTVTLAMGIFDRASRQFIAESVLVGSSVPGSTLDAVEGHVVARSGNQLSVRGASLIRTDGSVQFNQDIAVHLAESTVVRKPLKPFESLAFGDISVGQRVRILGQWDAESASFRAEEGRAHLLLTRLSATGIDNTASALQVNALAFGGRDVSLFDFTGTGATAEQDANAETYELGVDGLNLSAVDVGAPLQIRGYAAPFGSAAPDFHAQSVIDYSDARARLLVSWQGAGDAMAFSSLDATGLTLASEGAFGASHHIRRGAHRTDLLGLQTLPRIVPADSLFFGRGIYTIAQRGAEGGDLVFFSDFSSFVAELDGRFTNGATLKMLHATGRFDDGENRFDARGLSVVLRTPDLD